MHARVSLNLVTFAKWSVPESLEVARSIGVGTVSLSASLFPPEDDAAIYAIRDSGFAVASIGTGGLSLIDSPEETSARLAPLIDTASRIGASTAFAVTGPTPPQMPSDEAFERLCTCLAPSVEAARARGLRLCIENSGHATRFLGFIMSLADAILVAERTGVAITLEVQNCWHDVTLRQVLQGNIGHIAVAQISDFLVGEPLLFNRRVPGDGSIPLEWFMGALLDAGYAGVFDLEILGPAIEAEGYAAAMRRGCDWISERLVKWGA